MRRIFAIGDIHGCYDKLRALLDQLPIDWSRDRLVFIGDYIDRGPDPSPWWSTWWGCRRSTRASCS